MPTDTSVILSNEQVDAFEDEMRQQFIASHPGLMLNLSMLCQTVRVLRKQLAHVQSKTHYLTCGARIEALEFRLKEVEEERDRLREGERQGRGIIRAAEWKGSWKEDAANELHEAIEKLDQGEQMENPYEDQLCIVCSYSIDSEGLCVMDSDHKQLSEDKADHQGD